LLSHGPRPISSPRSWKRILGSVSLPACCLQLPFGIWSASSNSARSGPEVKDNSMHECFGIFLRVAEFAPPMSRRPAANRRESLLPSLMPEKHQTGIVFDPRIPAGPTRTINGYAGEQAKAWTRHTTHCRPAKQISQTIEGAISDLVAGNDLLARLIFQRIRPRIQSGMISKATHLMTSRQLPYRSRHRTLQRHS